VIEHIAHTPRPLLNAIDHVLAPGGVLILDTPNIAYYYNRQKLGRGISIMPALERVYDTALPFEGHHREFTIDEVRWMLGEIGHVDISIDTFNYSVYSLKSVDETEREAQRIMARDPSMREVIFAVSRKHGATDRR